MKLKYLICNLKGHKTYQEMLPYREDILNLRTDVELILAPSNIYLSLFKGMNLALCVQNIDANEELEITGDVSIRQLKSVGVSYCLVGHYERRKIYKETEYEFAVKINKALNEGLKVIYCVGETKEELDRKIEYQVLEKSIAKVLNQVDRSNFRNIIIAYEPTYLIGQKINYDIKHIKTTIHFIKKLVLDYYDANIDVVFGGNIHLNNIDDFLDIKELDGFIIGSSCLDTQNIQKILKKMT